MCIYHVVAGPLPFLASTTTGVIQVVVFAYPVFAYPDFLLVRCICHVCGPRLFACDVHLPRCGWALTVSRIYNHGDDLSGCICLPCRGLP